MALGRCCRSRRIKCLRPRAACAGTSVSNDGTGHRWSWNWPPAMLEPPKTNVGADGDESCNRSPVMLEMVVTGAATDVFAGDASSSAVDGELQRQTCWKPWSRDVGTSGLPCWDKRGILLQAPYPPRWNRICAMLDHGMLRPLSRDAGTGAQRSSNWPRGETTTTIGLAMASFFDAGAATVLDGATTDELGEIVRDGRRCAERRRRGDVGAAASSGGDATLQGFDND